MSQPQVYYDNKSQYERIAPLILQGETLFAVYDMKGGGTGFLGLTDKRLIFMDNNFLDRKDTALISIPYSRVSYVAIQTEHKMIGRDTGSLTVAVTGRTFEFVFNGLDKAHRAHGLILWRICG